METIHRTEGERKHKFFAFLVICFLLDDIYAKRGRKEERPKITSRGKISNRRLKLEFRFFILTACFDTWSLNESSV